MLYGPAEAQGLLCGLFCSNPHADRSDWYAMVLDGGKPSEGEQILLDQIYDRTAAGLLDQDFGLELLLPGDEIDLGERTGQLSEWACGFLYAFEMGRGQGLPLSETVTDYLDVLLEFTRSSFDTEDGGDEDELAYIEIVEYVRIGVLAIHDTLQPSSKQPAPGLH